MTGKKSAEEMELDREEQQLRNEAEAIDPVRPEDAELNDDANPADARAAARESHPSPKGERPGSDKSPDVTGTDKPEASKEAKKTDPKPGEEKPAKGDTKPEQQAAQTPFQKERARLNDSWKKLEADKEALRAEREALAAERRAASGNQQQQRTPSAPAAKPLIDGADADTWEAVANDFKAEGKVALAAKAMANAENLRKQEAASATQSQAQQAPAAQQSPEEQAAIRTEWTNHLQKLAEQNPELKQAGTPLRTRVAELIKQVPLLSLRGDGIVYAVEYAKAELRAGQLDAQVKSLTEKLTALEQEKKRLESLTALPSGTTSPQNRGTRKFEDLSLDEQESELRGEAEAA